jgi:hypothetical protein
MLSSGLNTAAAPREIAVAPVQGGWAVSWTGCACPLMFLSGARAEAEACRLAAGLAALGHAVEVLVHDRQGALIAAIRYAVETPAEPRPARRRLAEVWSRAPAARRDLAYARPAIPAEAAAQPETR